MLLPLLATKFYIPPVRENSVPRPRLNKLLSSSRPLTVIAAPAGFGKTTAISQWIAGIHDRVTWLSLDEEDNDPARFWTYFIAALQKVNPDLGQDGMRFLQSPQPPPIPSILTALINDIAAFREDFFLVLDDYHVIKTSAIHDAMMFLLEHLPRQMHILLSTRADPPLPLARLRARNQLTELRADALRFTIDETAMFLNEVMGLRLVIDEIAVLESRTEGWVAGLQLAALSMQNRKDIKGFIQEFSGNHRHVLTYLAEEVLAGCPESTYNFLLQTSILAQLSGPLCDAVTGRSDGEETLKELERANLFLVPLDDNGKWYRYHHLFGDLLRYRLNQRHPDQIAGFHRNASQWYEQAGLTSPAVQHALSAQDFDRAARLMEQFAPAMIQRGEFTQLLNWLEALPTEIRNRPLLTLYHVWVLYISGQINEAATLLAGVEAKLEKDGSSRTPELQGLIAAVRSRLLREAGDLAATIALSRQAMGYLSKEEALLRPRIALNLAIAHFLEGELEPASQLLTDIIAANQAAQLMAPLPAIYIKAEILRVQGHLQQALQLCQDELDRVTRHGWQDFPAVGYLYVTMGDLLRERNDLDSATKFLERGIKLGQEGGQHHILIIGHIWLAWLRRTQGLAEGSHEDIRAALQLTQQHRVSRFWPLPSAVCYQARLWIAQGNLAKANQWAEDNGLRPEDSTDAFLFEAEYLTLSRLLIAQGNLDAAETLLLGLNKSAAAAGRNGRLIEILILLAITFAAQKRNEEALSALADALSLAEGEDFVRIFLDEGQPLTELLRRAVARDLHASYALRLLNALGEKATATASPQPLIEPLSERELEVLHLLADGLSNDAIARKLFLSTGTVKVHLKHIYGKLAVNSRTQAVVRSRELNLL